MKTKLTIYDCFKYPNAVIREYKNGKQIKGEYKNILQLISFKCLTVWNESDKQIIDANKYLKNCKLILKDAASEHDFLYYGANIFYLPEADKLRADNYDIDSMKETGRAVYE